MLVSSDPAMDVEATSAPRRLGLRAENRASGAGLTTAASARVIRTTANISNNVGSVKHTTNVQGAGAGSYKPAAGGGARVRRVRCPSSRDSSPGVLHHCGDTHHTSLRSRCDHDAACDLPCEREAGSPFNRSVTHRGPSLASGIPAWVCRLTDGAAARRQNST